MATATNVVYVESSHAYLGRLRASASNANIPCPIVERGHGISTCDPKVVALAPKGPGSRGDTQPMEIGRMTWFHDCRATHSEQIQGKCESLHRNQMASYARRPVSSRADNIFNPLKQYRNKYSPSCLVREIARPSPITDPNNVADCGGSILIPGKRLDMISVMCS
ncbi:hypothetical protein GJ496_009417 [Pomphorhynchus laevis]|nr:hypothetical protein GJ496_009417 [Pomphorhynchus laevis]